MTAPMAVEICSTLVSGDAGSAESNIRKWLLDSDIVKAVIQLPTDEFLIRAFTPIFGC